MNLPELVIAVLIASAWLFGPVVFVLLDWLRNRTDDEEFHRGGGR